MMCLYVWPSAPTVAPSGLGGGGGDRNELIVTWTVRSCFSVVCVYVCVFAPCAHTVVYCACKCIAHSATA